MLLKANARTNLANKVRCLKYSCTGPLIKIIIIFLLLTPWCLLAFFNVGINLSLSAKNQKTLVVVYSFLFNHLCQIKYCNNRSGSVLAVPSMVKCLKFKFYKSIQTVNYHVEATPINTTLILVQKACHIFYCITVFFEASIFCK